MVVDISDILPMMSAISLMAPTDSWLSGANYTEAQLRQMKHTVEPNVLYENDGKGKFRALTVPEPAYKTLSHDAVLEDLDHDGRIDLYVGVDAESGNKWATSKGGNPLWTRVGEDWKEVGKAADVRYEGNCVCVPTLGIDREAVAINRSMSVWRRYVKLRRSPTTAYPLNRISRLAELESVRNLTYFLLQE